MKGEFVIKQIRWHFYHKSFPKNWFEKFKKYFFLKIEWFSFR